MLLNQVAYSCSQRGRQVSNEECKQAKKCKQALCLPCVQASKEEMQASCILLCVSYAYSQCIFCVCNVISEAIIHVCKALGKQAKINKQAMNGSKQRRKSKQAVFYCVSVFRNNFCVCYVT